MKKILAVALVIVTLGLAVSCQKSGTQSGGSSDVSANKVKPIKIGVSLQGMTPFVMALKSALEDNVARYNNKGVPIDITILDGSNDAAKQVAHCENFVQQGMDVILLNAISFDGCAPGVDAAVAAHIPVITLITEVANQDKAASFCGSKHYDSGVMVMENAIKDLGDSFSCVIIEGVMGIDAQIQRMKGFKDVMAKHPNIKVVDVQTANWDRPEAMKVMENWIQGGKKFDVVISENDNMALGAIEVLKNAGLKKIPVYGVDGDSDALVAIKNGEYAGTAYMSAVGQATKAIDFAVALAQGRPQDVEKTPSIPFEWINASNVDKYLK